MLKLLLAAWGLVGAASQEAKAPEERQGLLWDCYRQLQKNGFGLDALGYTTCFRYLGLLICMGGSVIRDAADHPSMPALLSQSGAACCSMDGRLPTLLSD